MCTSFKCDVISSAQKFGTLYPIPPTTHANSSKGKCRNIVQYEMQNVDI